MQGNIRIVLTLSILKNKNTVTTDWMENKINKVHYAYFCFIEFNVGNWSEKKTTLLCFVLFGNMSLVLVQFPIPVGFTSTSVSYCKITNNSRAHQNER